MDLVGRILARPARLGRTRLVAVDGPSGAGKTVFAARLAAALDSTLRTALDSTLATALATTADAALGITLDAVGTTPGSAPSAVPDTAPGAVPVVHTDELLDGWADQFTFWPRLDEWVLAPLRADQPGRYRRYDWARRRFTRRWVSVPPAPVLIIEGVTTARAAIRPELTFAVFVTAPPVLRLDRALARDGAALRPYLEEWRRAEGAHFAADATREHVDLVVDGAPEQRHDPALGYVRLAGAER